MKILIILCIISVVFGDQKQKPKGPVYPTSVSGFIHVAQVNIDVSRIEGAKEKIKSDVWMKMCMGSAGAKGKFKLSKLVPSVLKSDPIFKVISAASDLVREFEENYKMDSNYYSEDLFQKHKALFEKHAKKLAEKNRKSGYESLIGPLCEDMYSNLLIMHEAKSTPTIFTSQKSG